jgi:predicted DNA-binding protein
MPISLRIPPEKEKKIQKYAKKAGMTKTAVILSAVDEKLGLAKSREQTIRELAGWLSREEAAELREAVEVFSQINEGDWE